MQSKPSIGQRLRAGIAGFVNGTQPVIATPPPNVQAAQATMQQQLQPSRFDPTKLGGSDSRAAQILATLTQQGNMPLSPASKFVPADQAIMELMYQGLSPQNPLTATPLYAPGAPLMPIPGITPPAGPRQWSFPVGGNISMIPRGEEEYSFDDLRALARIYDGFQICVQVWLDYVSKLNLAIELRPELQTEDLDMAKYAKDIAFYQDWFSYPDKQHDIKSWLRLAVKEQLEIDALAIYPRLANNGTLYALEILDGATIKPLVDDRGRRPEPPFPAYEQYLYGGVPAAWLTTGELIYMVETEKTDGLYGTPRVEKVLMRANQALRKQSKDLLKFTEGTVPAGFIQIPSDSPWTQDQLEEFEINLNALMAGNDMARARLKVLPKGFIHVATDDPITQATQQTMMDTFLMNVTASAFGLTMAELGFTENVNKSSGDSQENVTYRRTMAPLVSRYEDLLTMVLRKYFNETRFIVKFKGFEQAEDFQANVAAYNTLVLAGIQSPTQAAQALHLPVYDDLNVPPFVMTKSGPFVISDLANDALRDAQVQAQLSGLQLAGQQTQPGDSEDDDEETEESSDQAKSGKPAPGAQTTKKNAPGSAVGKASESDQRMATADYRRWRDRAIDDVKHNRSIRSFASDAIDERSHRYISRALQSCATAEDVKRIFAIERAAQPQGVNLVYNAKLDIWEDEDSAARIEQYRKLGVEALEWVNPGHPCDQCVANFDVIRPLGKPFPTGHLLPPVHPHCACSTIPVMKDAGQAAKQ